MSSSNCCFLFCIQVSQKTGKVVWYSHFIKNIPQFVVIHTVKGFNIVNEPEVDFLKFSCFFYDPVYVGNLISGSSAFSKSSLYFWTSSVHILLKPILKNFEHNLASMWNECNCVVIWRLFGIALLWDHWEGVSKARRRSVWAEETKYVKVQRPKSMALGMAVLRCIQEVQTGSDFVTQGLRLVVIHKKEKKYSWAFWNTLIDN